MASKKKPLSKNRLLVASMAVFIAVCSFKIVSTQMEVSAKQYELEQLEKVSNSSRRSTRNWKISWSRERTIRARSSVESRLNSTGMVTRTNIFILTARPAELTFYKI